MSPKMNSGCAEWSAAQQAAGTAAAEMKVPAAADSALVSFPEERGLGFAPMTPPPEDRATTGWESSRPSAPRVRRRSALKIASTPPPLPSPPAAANKRRTPSSMSVNARSSSVVASKGMLFSRSELRPPPLSASRKYDGNVGFGFRSLATGAGAASSLPGNGVGGSGDGSLSRRYNPTPAGEGTRGSPSTTAAGAVRPRESFATLRIIEARRRAAWSFSDSSPSLSSPPPSLAALGSATSATTGTGTAAAAKKPAAVPPLPKISSIFIPTPACPLRQPGESNDNGNKVAAATAANPASCFNTNPTPVLSPAASKAETATVAVAVGAPLSDPRSLGKACQRESLERKWAAWQENEGPAPLLGKPASAPVAVAAGAASGTDGDTGAFGGSSGQGESRKWGGVGDFHEKVAILGDYVASVFGRTKRVSVPQHPHCDEGVYEVECGVE